MEDYSNMLDLPSPYMYGDAEHYLDTNGSESQSSVNSPYDMSSLADLNSFSSVYPSPDSEEESSQPATQQKPAAKRKRENRYKNAPPSVLSRRRAQNRASQRAYRERKDQRIKDLEQMLNDAKQRNDVLGQAYAALHSEYISLKSSHYKDQAYHSSDAHLSYNPSMSVSGSNSNDRLDMDLYVYPDMTSGSYSL
ncbi:hypothetical protein B0H66DRAFT_124395 [Apodospora peruviana]|uniref:Putative transcription factor kapC n=1 Tax=Apodospora peruviana TaxID=516989 RepID=A0AAE0IHZ1_9PEZI|nr:hypothetical protein B0H66DRAFT_124395 [Apodospora peruviana]